MQLDIYMLYINDFVVYNPDVILIHDSIETPRDQMRFPFLGCFLGAHVAVQYLSVRGCWGGESHVIAQNAVRTVHPSRQRTALKDSPQGPPSANRRQPPTAANCLPLFNTVSVVLCCAHVLTMKQRASPDSLFLLAL